MSLSDASLDFRQNKVIKVVTNINDHEITKLKNQYEWLCYADLKKRWWGKHSIKIPSPMSLDNDDVAGKTYLAMERVFMKGHGSCHMYFDKRHVDAIQGFANMNTFTGVRRSQASYLSYIDKLVLRRGRKLVEVMGEDHFDLVTLTAMFIDPDTVNEAVERAGCCHGDFTLDNLGETADNKLIVLDPNFYPDHWQSPILDYAWFKFSCYMHDVPLSHTYTEAAVSTGAKWFIDLMSIGCAIRASYYAHRKLKTSFTERAKQYIHHHTNNLKQQYI